MADAAALARTVVAALVANGVRDVVLAPGSRSAPLALMIWAADRDSVLRLHVRIDERGAGFLALGLAKGSSAPVAVVTTSGTAVANLHPAVLEAWHSDVPLVVVSADRPAALRWTGANQTTHQEGLFGTHVRATATVRDAEAARFEVGRLLAAATGVRSALPGPVHLDVELDDPLVPEAAALDRPLPDLAGLDVAPTPRGEPIALRPGPRTVVVAGDLPVAEGRGWAARAGEAQVPLLAEPSSNARSGPAALSTYRLLLSTGLADEVERVVVVGHPTLSRPVTRLLARSDVELVVSTPYADWPDPGRQVSTVVGDVALPEPGLAQREWLARWQRADAAVAHRVAILLDARRQTTGPAVARTLLAALGARDVLVVGSSNPVRDLDLAPVDLGSAGPAVYANRGLAGIDGLVSTAVGVALATRRPTHALLGDLTLLHDATGLLVAAGEPRPDLRIVVADDDGGSIFATLEPGAAAYTEAFERVFATPQGADLEALARASGVGYRRVGTTTELAAALGERPAGIELLHVPVDRVDRRALDEAIRTGPLDLDV